MAARPRSNPLRAAFTLAVSRMQRRHLRRVLGFAWFFITPVCMFVLYWLVFGLGFNVAWRDPHHGGSVGYIAPFALGYCLYLFLSDVVGGSCSAIQGSAGLLKRAGLSMRLVVGSFAIEFLLRLCLYVAIALAITAAAADFSWLGALGFAAYGAIFMVQSLAIGATLMFLTPFVADLEEIARFGLRALVYAAGLTFPLAVYPDGLEKVLYALPLIGPLNAARDTMLFQTPPSAAITAFWCASTLPLVGLGYLAYRLLGRKVLDIL